jgi:hypothetical protein
MLRRIVYFCCYGIEELMSAMVRRWNFWFFGRRGAQMRVATKNVSKKLQLVTKLVKSSQTKELLKSSPE